MRIVIRTRRQWLTTALIWPACITLLAGGNEFWDTKDPAAWSDGEKQILLGQSPWSREGFARMEIDKKKRRSEAPRNTGKAGGDLPDTRPGILGGGVRSVPIGEPVPPVPNPDPGRPVEFRVLARWETARPVRLAGGPEIPELTGQFYVIRLRGLPLMPPRKVPQGEVAPDPNAGMLQAIRQNTWLERKGKRAIPCAHLFIGSGDEATQVLLFFPREDPITLADKVVTLESRFTPFSLTVKFPLKDMVYKGELAL